MSSIRCFEVAKMIIDEATGRFSPLWKINEEHFNVFEDYCDIIDSLAEEFDGVSFDVEVDEIAMTISITLECNEITIETDSHELYKLAQRAVKYSFAVSEDGNLLIKFVFPSLWEKV